jgi:hypothetical protein
MEEFSSLFKEYFECSVAVTMNPQGKVLNIRNPRTGSTL